jgi:hypothetical protein
MIIIRTRHRIESTSLIDMNHIYISKEYYQIQKCLERLICTLAFELLIVSGLSELKANNLQWSVAYTGFSQFLRSCHTSSRLPCADSLFLLIWGTSHMSQISSRNSMILCVRTQSICAIRCHHLCVGYSGLHTCLKYLHVIHRDFLLTSPGVRCCQLVPSFANSLGVFVLFQTSEFLLVWSNGSVAQASLCCRCPHLHYLVLIMCCCLFFVDLPMCT